MIYSSLDALIGNTPICRMTASARAMNAPLYLYAKLEFFNPAGSSKDRVAKAILDSAEASGRIQPNGVIIEPTSGNTGIAIAALSAARGYRAIIVMPDTMSVERQSLMRAYGAEVVLTPGGEGMSGAIRRAEMLAREITGSMIAGQFTNPDNPRVHFETTGPEIYRDMEGRIDYFVAGVGTGGTISGVGAYLKSVLPDVKIIAVEPSSSPLLTEGRAAPHKIQGIGANFVPKTLDTSIYDEVIPVTDEDAVKTAQLIAKNDGMLVGISSGAAFYAAASLAKRVGNENKRIVALLPDSGERYLSTPGFIQ